MKVVIKNVRMRSSIIAAGCVLVSGIFADNALSGAVHDPIAAWVFPVVCGLVVGSLTVLTYMRHSFAYPAGAALFSALSVIGYTLTLPRVEHIALLTLCALTAIVCAVIFFALCSDRLSTSIITVRVETRDEHR